MSAQSQGKIRVVVAKPGLDGHDRGAKVVAACCLIDRTAGKAKVGVPLIALAEWKVQAWPADRLPPHLRNIPAVKPGSRGLA